MEDKKYLNRITSEHRAKSKLMAWLAINLDRAEDTAALYRNLDAEFDLERAKGVQLDILGQSVGVPRLLTFEPVYASPLLSDVYYRMVLRAKISLNQWDGTIQGIKELWSGIFGGYTLEVVDWQDMSMTLRIIGLHSLFESEFISRGYLAPKPESVRVNYEFVLTRTIGTRLYTGGHLGHIANGFRLPVPAAVFQMNSGINFIGGTLGMMATRFALKNRPPPKNKTLSGKTVLGGRISIISIFSLPQAIERSI